MDANEILEAQENELEVLRSIYTNDFVEFPPTKRNNRIIRFKIKILPYFTVYDNNSSSIDNSSKANNVAVWLDVTYSSKYPMTVPILRIENDSTLPLSDNHIGELLNKLNDIANEYVGEVMVYQLCSEAQLYLRDHNRKRMSLHDEMLKLREKAARNEQLTRQRENEMKEAEAHERLRLLALRVEEEKRRKDNYHNNNNNNDNEEKEFDLTVSIDDDHSKNITNNDDNNNNNSSGSGNSNSNEDEIWFRQQQQVVNMSYGVSLPSVITSPNARNDDDMYGSSPSRSSGEIHTTAPTPQAVVYSRYKADFDELNLLGRGGFGEVWKARNKVDGLLYAVKKIKLTRHRPALRRKIMREVLLIARLHHQYIVRYFQAWVEAIAHDDINSSAKQQGELHALDMGIEPEDMFSDDDTRGNDDDDDDDSGSSSSDDNDDRDDWLSGGGGGGGTGNSMSTTRSHHHHYVIDATAEATSQSSVSALNSVSHRSEISESDNCTDMSDDDGMIIVPNATHDVLYIQMAWCSGHTLKLAITKGIQGHLKTVWRLFRQTLEAIAFIHSKNVVHRDIKPDNIFIDAQGNIKLGDFGLALSAKKESSSSQVVATEVVGTPFYRSPEQEAEGVSYDHKADLYAMGIILYEMTHAFSTGMERILALTELRKTGQIPKTNPPFDADDNVRYIIEWLVSPSTHRPSASELLRSGKIPMTVEDEFLSMAITMAQIPKTPFHNQLLEALFSNSNDDLTDLTYDYQSSNTSIDNKTSSSTSSSYIIKSITHYHTEMQVFNDIMKIFHRHGAIRLPTPLITPVPSKRVIKRIFHRSDAVTFLDHEGIQIQLPYCLTVPFARYIARNAENLLNNSTTLRRYDIAKVYRKNISGCPKELYECDFDIVWPNPMNSSHDEENREAQAYREAETIYTITEIVQKFNSALGSYMIRINHVDLLSAVLDEIFGSFTIDMNSSETITAYQKILQPKSRFSSPLHVASKSPSMLPSLSLDSLGPSSTAAATTTTNNTPIASSKHQPTQEVLLNEIKREIISHLKKRQLIGNDNISWSFHRSVLKRKLETHYGHLIPTKILKRLGMYLDLRTGAKTNLDFNGFFRKLRNTLVARSNRRQGAQAKITNAIDNLKSLYNALIKLGIHDDQICLDLSVLASDQFNDGIIFQVLNGTTTNGPLNNLLAVGGRYDSLISRFRPPNVSKIHLSAVGCSFAVEKLTTSVINWLERMQERNLRAKLINTDKKKTKREVIGVGNGVLLQGGSRSTMLDQRCDIASKLWKRGIRAEWNAPTHVDNSTSQYCLECGIRFIVAFRSNDQVKVKDLLYTMKANTWQTMMLNEVVDYICNAISSSSSSSSVLPPPSS